MSIKARNLYIIGSFLGLGLHSDAGSLLTRAFTFQLRKFVTSSRQRSAPQKLGLLRPSSTVCSWKVIYLQLLLKHLIFTLDDVTQVRHRKVFNF